MGRRLMAAVLAGLAVIVFAEAVSFVVYRRLQFPTAYDTARNPNFRRGWEEYTRPVPRRNGEKRVIVISNSQGFLRERREGELDYSAQLEVILKKRSGGADYEVLNWSIAGARSPEMILLAARAAAHAPDVVFLVFYAPNFTGVSRRIGYYISDTHRLAYLHDVRKHLPRDFLERHKAHQPIAWFRANTYLGRLANFLEWRRVERWTWTPWEPSGKGKRSQHTEAPWNGRASTEMRDFYATLRSAAPKCRLVIVNMPQNQRAYTLDGWQNIRDATRVVRRLFKNEPGVEVRDATGLIPFNLFYQHTGTVGRGAAAHMKPAGHAKFARWLGTVVLGGGRR